MRNEREDRNGGVPIDKLFDVSFVRDLRVMCALLLFETFIAHLLKGIVIAGVGVELFVVEVDNVRDHVVQKFTIVTHDKQRLRPLQSQILFQPQDSPASEGERDATNCEERMRRRVSEQGEVIWGTVGSCSRGNGDRAVTHSALPP